MSAHLMFFASHVSLFKSNNTLPNKVDKDVTPIAIIAQSNGPLAKKLSDIVKELDKLKEEDLSVDSIDHKNAKLTAIQASFIVIQDNQQILEHGFKHIEAELVKNQTWLNGMDSRIKATEHLKNQIKKQYEKTCIYYASIKENDEMPINGASELAAELEDLENTLHLLSIGKNNVEQITADLNKKLNFKTALGSLVAHIRSEIEKLNTELAATPISNYIPVSHFSTSRRMSTS